MIEIIQIFSFVILIFSIVIHEFAHGWMANSLGDPTAKFMGRLTLNPIAHIDLVGSVILPLFLLLSGSSYMFGWAKPVPYNPYNLRDKKKGELLVAVAGPVSNLMIALIFGIIIRMLLLQGYAIDNNIIIMFGIIVLYNVLLAVFNLVPIPPLDGSKVLFHFLPYSMQNIREVLEKNGMIFIILFIFFGFQFIIPIILILFVFMTGSSDLLMVMF
ncbi:MAG: site-2 protease family protein [Candidatus Pacebacteria bacterium]|nr:site-2 protease family protein [Candidatus Paceibacterota bacterium]